MLAGAATCFYGYVGFDSIATSGEETKSPQTSIPISICLSLFIVFLGYFGVSSALTLMVLHTLCDFRCHSSYDVTFSCLNQVPYYLQDADAPLPNAFHYVGWNFAGMVVSVGALFGLSTSLLGAMFPLPRVIYAMASDGLVFRWLAHVSPTFQTPLRATVVSGVFAGLMAALFELKSLVDMMSIGTLMAYTIVSASVILLRYQDVPGLAQTNNGEYMALGTLTDEEAKVLRGDDESSGDDDDDIVYARSTQVPGASRVIVDDDEEGLGLKLDRDGSPVFPSVSSFLCGLFNAEKQEIPTKRSVKVTTVLTTTYLCMAAVLALILDHSDLFGGGGGAVLLQILAGLLAFSMTACLLCLSLQPKTTQHMSFQVPLVPLLPGASILINLYLMLKLSPQTWVRFAVWMAVGLSVYFLYGIRNSSEEYRRRGARPPNEADDR